MKHEVLLRPLSTGDFVVFSKKTKDLYLINTPSIREWNKTDKSLRALKRMMKEGKVRRFNQTTLKKLRAALRHIDFKL